MPLIMPRSPALLAVLLSFSVLAACSQHYPGAKRAAVDALDKATAMARKARISNLEYDALIDIAQSEEELVGKASIQFDLSDASSDLTIDFTGGTVNSIRVNGWHTLGIWQKPLTATTTVFTSRSTQRICSLAATRSLSSTAIPMVMTAPDCTALSTPKTASPTCIPTCGPTTRIGSCHRSTSPTSRRISRCA